MQLLDTLKYGRCVFREPAKGKPFVGRGATEHILPDAQIFVRLKYVSVGTSGRRRGLIFLSEKLLIFSKEFSFNGRRLKYFCQIAANRKTVAG